MDFATFRVTWRFVTSRDLHLYVFNCAQFKCIDKQMYHCQSCDRGSLIWCFVSGKVFLYWMMAISFQVWGLFCWYCTKWAGRCESCSCTFYLYSDHHVMPCYIANYDHENDDSTNALRLPCSKWCDLYHKFYDVVSYAPDFHPVKFSLK